MEGRSLDGMRKLPEVESCLVPRSLVGWKGIETLREGAPLTTRVAGSGTKKTRFEIGSRIFLFTAKRRLQSKVCSVFV